VSVVLSTLSLKLLSGVGAVAVCGVSGLLVAADPKPLTAPLRPPVNGSPSSTASLHVPPSCGSGTLAPSLLPIVQQLRQATTASARRTILAALRPTQRLEIEAYLRPTGRSAIGASTSCANVGGDSIAPSVVEAPASTQPLINTYVS
jgi:hypothetical protein